MRLAVLMNTAIPWAREVALGLSGLGHQVHAVDFLDWSASNGHHRAQDGYQADELKLLRESLASVDFLESSVSSGLRYFTTAPKLNALLKRYQAEVLLSLYGGGFASTAYASGFRPYAVYVVGSDVLLATGVRRAINRVALRGAAAVYANGQYLAEQTRRMAPRAPVSPLCLGIDTDLFVPAARPPSPVSIVCTRGFAEIYNNESLILALADLPEDTPDFKVTFVSGGPTLASAQKLADELLSPERRAKVNFLGGVSRKCLIEILRNSHTYFSGSRSDGTSASLLEALSAGLFPVLSDIPPNREWISTEANNGILFPLDRPSCLAAALQDAICNSQGRAQVADYNRRLVLDRASSKHTLQALSSALETIRKEHNGQP